MDPTTEQLLTPGQIIAAVCDLAAHEKVIDQLIEEMKTRREVLENRQACVTQIRRRFARHTLATGTAVSVLLDGKLCLIPRCPKGYGSDHEVYPEFSTPIIAASTL